MKKLFVSFMTALFIGTSAVTFAAPLNDTIPQETSIVVRTQNLKLDVVTPAHDDLDVMIRLRGAKGNTLLKKHVSQSNEAKRFRFDLSNLEDGEYQVEINDGISKQVKVFTIQTTPPSLTSTRSVSLS